MATSSSDKHQSDSNSEDWISKQPDEVLVEILSLLTIKEAGRTSVLSTRWRNLWKLTSHLDLDAPKELFEVSLSDSTKFRDAERIKYVTWVNQVMRLHERTSIEEFRVRFDLDASASDDIDEWIKFAIVKRAKKIEIDLSSLSSVNPYSLSQEYYQYLKSPSNLSNIIGLRSLSLGEVNVNGELLEYLLSKCPHLGSLCVSNSDHLVDFIVAGPNLPLKYLNISSCKSLKCIELCAPRLETFIYFGREANFVIGSNPRLALLDIGGVYGQNVVTSCLGLFSSLFSKLEVLSLMMRFQDDMDIPQVSELRNLKHLILKIRVRFDLSIIGFTKFIHAAPSLAKLTLQLKVDVPEQISIKEPLVEPHGCLKEVEIFGYTGCIGNFEIARYLVKNATNLEKMVIDPYCPDVYRAKKEIEKRAKKIRRDIEVLKRSLPPRAELTVNNV